MKTIKILFKTVFALAISCTTVMAQPTVAKDISGVSQLNGSQLPSAVGWTQVTSTGSASIVGGDIFLSGGTNQQYTFSVSPTTTPSFEPSGDYTIELRIKVPASTGRGFDMVLRDKVGRYSIGMGTSSIVNQASSNASLTSVDGTVYHTYRFSVIRATRTLYLYVDGVYKNTVTGTSNTNCDLQLGKGENAATTSVYLDYVSYDLSGAYSYDTYSVDFESNGGTAVAQQILGKNLFMPRFTAPTRTGYNFVGWYKDAGLTNEWNFDQDKVTENTTLYAQWEVALPVTLVHFDAKSLKEGVLFTWDTSSETNNNRFEIQHSVNGNDFKTVAVRTAEGEAANYTALHNNPIYGVNYYRLVQYDNNGDYKIYPIQSVNYTLEDKRPLVIYPNPVKDYIQIKMSGYQGEARLQLFNMAGQIVFDKNHQVDVTGKTTLTVSNLPKGIYMLRVLGKGFKQNKTLIIE